MPQLRIGSTDHRPAITLVGRTWTYRQLDALIRASVESGTRTTTATGPVLLATGLPRIEALAGVFAAAATGLPVVVADPTSPWTPRRDSVIPAGTFLIAVTSGTSGRPRPVARTAASWTTSFGALAELAGITPDDRVLLTGPLHATLHLFAAVHTLAIGAELTDRPERATALHAVPTVLEQLLRELPPSAPLRSAIVAGSALPDGVARQAIERRIAVTEYYGAAELSFVAARRYPNPFSAFPGAQVQVRSGELWVRSPYLALGYLDGITGPLRRDDTGFATVGDLAESLPDSGLRIRGRGDAAITTGGATVIAEDVESVLTTLPGVAAVAVVGVPHSSLGQIVTAVIEPASGGDLGGLRASARAVLRDQSLPRRWLLTDRLPRTPSGKIARQLVALAAVALAAGQQPPDGSPRLRPLP
jgi:acyl-CoA synthetase (AMP-forming)/AMP-acid ligase II